MLRLVSFLMLAFIALSNAGCGSVDPEPVCSPVPPYSGDIGFYGELDTLEHVFPSFDPESDEEYVFLYGSHTARKLAVGNISTRTARGIVDADWKCGPHWGPKGSIVFNPTSGYLGSVATVNPDGSNLTTLTPAGVYFQGPAWNFDGTAVIARQLSGYTVLLSPAGHIVDTVAAFIGRYATRFIDATSMLTMQLQSPDAGTVGIFSIPSQTYTPITGCNPRTFSGWAVLNAAEFVWSDGTGIYLSNRETLSTERLRETCDAVLYTSPSINRSRSKILWSKKTTAVSADHTTLFIRTELVTTDLRGGNEENVTPVLN